MSIGQELPEETMELQPTIVALKCGHEYVARHRLGDRLVTCTACNRQSVVRAVQPAIVYNVDDVTF